MYEIICVKLDVNWRTELGIYNWNFGGGSTTTVIRMFCRVRE
jgi:hypothetical protein